MTQRVLLTAGASGIGLEIAKAFRATGAKVHLCDINDDAVKQIRNDFPDLSARRVDVSDETAINNWLDEAVAQMGGVDVLINNAGTKGPTGYVEDLPLQDWQNCLAVCLESHFLTCKKVAPIMKAQRSGSIVNISSTAGLFGYGLRTPYAAAKWAVIGLTKSLAIELGPFEVRANAVCPGSVDGARMAQVIAAEAASRAIAPEQVAREYVQSQSIKRFVKPEEIAAMCVFLSSPSARMVTGQAICVDGHTETFHIDA